MFSMLSVCASGEFVSTILHILLGGDFTKFTTLVHFRTKMKFLDFEVN